MKPEELQQITESISQKLGSDNYATISEDIAKIITENNKFYQESEENKETITKLQNEKNHLVEINGNLMQNISVSTKNMEQENKNTNGDKLNISFDDMFDEKGNFK